ncbi:MAG: hypothetical protein SWK76_00570 [Actinomycetota bacterium]|nr:hypothetical protein [Actinomycetota bacterium]
MRRKTGKEMRHLLVAVSLTTLLLVLAIIAYFIADAILTANNNIEQNKERIIEESVRNLQDMDEMSTMSTVDPIYFEIFNPEIIEEVLSGNTEFLYDITVRITQSLYPVDYISIVRDGEVLSYQAKDDMDIDTSKLPAEPPESGYLTLDSLGDEEGFFISVSHPIDLGIVGMEGEVYLNLIVNRTEELADIEIYFEDQRNSMIVRLSIGAAIAIILSLLLTTFGLRYFTRKYVVKPIEGLNRTAEEIAAGTFEGDVEVDKESAYAALQGLLSSGQKVLRLMDEELDK